MLTPDSYVVVIPLMTAVLKDLLHVVALFSDGIADNGRRGIFHLLHVIEKRKFSKVHVALMASEA